MVLDAGLAPRFVRTALISCTLAVCALAAFAAPAGAIPATIIAGTDRYETAVELSRAGHPLGASAVIVASGTSWPDALGGSALAGVLDAPILLAEQRGLPAKVEAEIRRLRPERAVVLGGEKALSLRVEGQLARALPSGAVIERIDGADRYVVSRRVAARVVAEAGSAPARAFVVTGRVPYDALSVAAPAVATGWPVVLANPNQPSRAADTLAAIGVPAATIAGGTAAVPASVEGALATTVGRANVVRLASADRYGVSLRVAQYARSIAGFDLSHPFFASGVSTADALAAGPLAASSASPVLLVGDGEVPDALAQTLFSSADEVGAFTFVGGDVPIPPIVRAEAAFALRARPFLAGEAMEHVQALTALGPRAAGSTAEKRAADYVAAQLSDYGYAVSRQTVYLPEGKRSQNVVATRPGTSPGVIVLGAHMDSKPPSPGANDNASGLAVTLELARCLSDAEISPTVRFVAFGAEEIGGPTPDDHHFGSRQYVESLSAGQLNAIEGMVSIDMVGYGSTFNVRSLGLAPRTVVGSLESWGRRSREPLAYLRDFGRYGWSDHEAFEHAGVPVAWLEWREDAAYHTTRDTFGHVSRDRVRRTGRLVRGWLVDMTAEELAALR